VRAFDPEATVGQINHALELRALISRFAADSRDLDAVALANGFRGLEPVRRLGARHEPSAPRHPGNIVRGYRHLRHAAYLFGQIEDTGAARELLARLAESSVTTTSTGRESSARGAP